MLLNEYPVISSNLKVGFGVFGTADPYNAALPNNGALNPPGSLYTAPSLAQSGSNLSSAVGYGAFTTYKYVRYLSTSNPAMVAGPAVVYYTDETFSTVSGKFTEGMVAATGNASAVAGWLCPNTGSVAGVGVGSAITATILNNGVNGSWVWIAVSGFVPSASLAAGAQMNLVYGSGDFVVSAIADNTSINHKAAGYIWGPVTSNIGDVITNIGIY
jgi:hypothetical protein